MEVEEDNKVQITTSTGQRITIKAKSGFEKYVEEKKTVMFKVLNLLITNDDANEDL